MESGKSSGLPTKSAQVMRTRARGVRMPEELAEEIHEIASAAHKHDNAAAVKLLELGMILYEKLPGSMRERIWRPMPKFTQQQSFRREVERRAEKLVDSSRMNAFIVFRVPSEKKRLLRSRAQDTKVSVSKFIRSKVLEEKAVGKGGES